MLNCVDIIYWVNYNDLIATSPEVVNSRGDYPQMTLIQVSEILEFSQIYEWRLLFD